MSAPAPCLRAIAAASLPAGVHPVTKRGRRVDAENAHLLGEEVQFLQGAFQGQVVGVAIDFGVELGREVRPPACSSRASSY